MSGPPNAREYPTPDQRRLFWTTLVALAVIALIGVAALVFMAFIAFLSWSYPILLPLGLAVIVALVLQPVIDLLERWGLKRGPATLGVCALAVLAFIIFWAFVLPPLGAQATGFFRSLPVLFTRATSEIHDELAQVPAAQAWFDENEDTLQRDAPGYIANGASKILAPVGTAFGFILGFGFVPIYVFYFLADQDHLTKHWQEFVPFRRGRVRDEVIAVIGEINRSLVSYLRGQIVVAAVNGLLTFIGLTLIRVPYSLVLGIIAGALSIVPFLGIIASIIPALLLAAFFNNGFHLVWLKPLLVLVVFALVQMSESMLVTPRVQSHSTGLHPLVIILGILVWSSLLPGLLGPVVAVPLTCALVVLLRRYVWQERGKKA
jgi:predicted PurR-regulated permease PerM